MHWLRKIAAFFRKEKLDADMAEEMRLHLERRVEENIASGMSKEEARYAALRKFGGVEQVKEIARDQRSFVWLEQAGQDLRYAARQLRRSPAFAVTAIAILALGIGATTAIFSVVHGLMLKPLPYEQPGQLVQLWEAPQPGQRNIVSVGVFLDWREQATLLEGMTAYSRVAMNFTGAGDPERVVGLRMTANGLQLLRARPIVGRVFAPGEDQTGRDKVVVLTHQLWQRRFGGDPATVGRTVRLNDESYTVIGVLPAGFLPFDVQEFVVPFVFEPQWRNQRDNHRLFVVGRLKPSVTIAQAHAELQAIAERNQSLYPAWKREWRTVVRALQEELAGDLKPALLVLLGAVGLVLLIACANVANLLLAKASVRQREIAVRAALGASRGRIMRQLLTESVMLAAIGAAVGLLLASWSVGALRNLLGTMNVARAHEVSLDVGVLGIAVTTAVATGLLFGLAPALQASRPNLDHALKDAARGSSLRGRGLRGSLIVAEVALALVLLVGAGLLLHSFARLTSVPPGFSSDRALTAQLTLSLQKYPTTDQRVALHHRLVERIAALPHVAAAGVAIALPLHGNLMDRFFQIDGRANPPAAGYQADFDFCSADYFAALGVELRRGRVFTAHETQTPARVAVINEALAREYFPGEDPVGRRIGHGSEMWEIVGIVGDVRMRSLAKSVEPMVYRPLSSGDGASSATLFVRSHGEPLAVLNDVRGAIRSVDPALPIANVSTLETILADSVSDRRLTLGLLGAFAATALLLAAVGLYGVIAYTVSQRTREFGIRVALGASREAILGLVLRHGLKLVAVGVVLGLGGALSLSHLLTGLLHEIKPTDPVTFVGVPVILVLVALLAAWLPARRAAKVDPMVALRSE